MATRAGLKTCSAFGEPNPNGGPAYCSIAPGPSPRIAASIDTPWYARDVTLSGDRAYVANWLSRDVTVISLPERIPVGQAIQRHVGVRHIRPEEQDPVLFPGPIWNQWMGHQLFINQLTAVEGTGYKREQIYP